VGEWIYFLRKAQDQRQLFRMALSGGEAEQLTHFKAGVDGYEVSPDGLRIALITLGDYGWPKPDEPKTFDVWPVKYDTLGYMPNVRNQLWLYEWGTVRLWLKPKVSLAEVAWGTDSRQLFFTASGSEQERWNWIQRLYRLDLKGKVREVLGGTGPLGGLCPTPDGKGMVYLGHSWERGGGTEAKLWYLEFGAAAQRAEPRVIAEASFTNTVNSDCRNGAYENGPLFGPDGQVYMLATDRGSSRVLRVSLKGKREWLSPHGENVAALAWCDKELFTLTDSFTHTLQLRRGKKVLLDPNAGLFRDFPKPQYVEWSSPEGHTVPGWLHLPKGPRKKHPVILYVHGGPHTAFGSSFILEHQLYRQAGYAVLIANPRGSTSYSDDYANLKTRWGDVDVHDLLGILNHATSEYQLDPKRQAVAGGSYGGYMTNWLTATHPRRFKAAVTDRSICNWMSFFGASDIGPRFASLELGASPWENPEVLWNKSPLKFVHQVKTPTLVVHSEQDHRCPIDQGETWYTLLLHKGVPTRFLRVPEESHELSRGGRPDRRVARLEAYLGWFRKYL
jgi:dipeptidyl aminopeptidase/acylaminoacyl peptidase